MKTLLLSKWLHILVYATMNVAITTHKELWQPGAVPVVVSHHRMSHAVILEETPLNTSTGWSPRISGAHDYLYQFHGRALYKGLPVSNASVVLHVTTKRDSIVRGTITDADGNYTIEMMVCGKNTEAVHWWLHSYTPDSQPVDLEGSRIILQEDEKVVVQNGLDLQAS